MYVNGLVFDYSIMIKLIFFNTQNYFYAHF